MLAKVTIATILQHINISNQHAAHLKVAQLYVKFTLIKDSKYLKWGTDMPASSKLFIQLSSVCVAHPSSWKWCLVWCFQKSISINSSLWMCRPPLKYLKRSSLPIGKAHYDSCSQYLELHGHMPVLPCSGPVTPMATHLQAWAPACFLKCPSAAIPEHSPVEICTICY